jgi:hypothetical protein
MNFRTPRHFAMPFSWGAVGLVLALTANILAQQSLSIDSAISQPSTNSLQPVSKSWRDDMLERQLRGGLSRPFDFNSSSLNGIAVAPTPSASHERTESSATRRKKEALERMKFQMLMNMDDPSKETDMDALLSELNMDPQMSGSVEQMYFRQLQQDHSNAVSRALAESDFRNAPGNGNVMSSRGVAPKNGSPPAASSSLFPDLFSSRASSDNSARSAQARVESRRTFDAGSPGLNSASAATRSESANVSGFSRMLNTFSAPTRTSAGINPAPAVALPSSVPAPTLAPLYEAPKRETKQPSSFESPRRKF